MPINHNPLVYIIVLTWNGKTDTIECIKSLQGINYPNYRILVVDNASVDETATAIREQFPNVEVIVSKENLRFAGGNNIGIQYALSHGADYILLLNNDTIVDRNFLTYLITTAESDKNIGMVGPKIYYYSDPNRIWYAGGKIDWWMGWLSHIGVRETDNGQHSTPKETDFISGCCLLVKRAVIEKIGVLDTAYYIYGEDVDWCIRATQSCFKLFFEPKGKIWHKLSVSTGGHLSWFKNWNKLKSQIRIMLKYTRVYHWISIPFGIIYKTIGSYIKVRTFR
jgi:GT2 family glycosyltransferase